MTETRQNARTVDAVRVPDALAAEDQPGAFDIKRSESGVLTLRSVCPCGCKAFRALPIYGAKDQKPSEVAWRWNGDGAAPSLTPSIRDMGGCRYHGHLISGVWTFAADSGAAR